MNASEPRLVVVTGMSGAGKTTVLRALDDDGYYCVDNLPPSLAAATLKVCADNGIDRVALGMDIRVGAFLDAAKEALVALGHHPAGLEVIFLDASDEVLMRRFSETRRPHPVLATGPDALGVADGVRLERERLSGLRALATKVVDTSVMSVHDLRRYILDRPSGLGEPRMRLRVLSFGFKHGAPLDASVVFDVRFLDNPYFIPALKEHDGNDAPVREFVLGSPGCEELLEHLMRLLLFALPRYRREGKSYLTVAIGCTGGRHRSVVVANELARRLAEQVGTSVGIVHRDVQSGVMMTEVGGADGFANREDGA